MSSPGANSVQPASPAPDARDGESGAWREIHGQWQPLHGSFFGEGISIEWHDFHVDADMDWARSFHPGCLEICLNFSGTGWLLDGAAERRIEAGQIALYTTHPGRPEARREAGSLHRFLTLELSREFLRRHFAESLLHLKKPILHFIESEQAAPPYLEILPLPSSILSARMEFLQPPVPDAARATWYRAKVLGVLAQVIFSEDAAGELFCHRHLRQNRDRVERVRYLIERDLENPPTLEMLANEVECSPFHLSRIFAEEAGMSIPRFLRTKRIERAAELLKARKMNVTDAAMTVGYSSLSAFNKAFVEQIGCCPGLYPAVKIQGRKPRTPKA